jgi:hypothetical protein
MRDDFNVVCSNENFRIAVHVKQHQLTFVRAQVASMIHAVGQQVAARKLCVG